MSSAATILAEQQEWTRDWTRRLITDLQGDDWSAAPAPGLAHATWIAGHLAVSQHVLVFVRCLGQSVLADEFVGKFPIGGAIPRVAPGAYPPLEQILNTFDEMQERTLAAIRGMSDALLREPAFGKDGQPHPHYCDKLGAVSHVTRHEAFHAGQLAMIRRLCGRPFLR
jgi:hypothetical protein